MQNKSKEKYFKVYGLANFRILHDNHPQLQNIYSRYLPLGIDRLSKESNNLKQVKYPV